MADVTLNLIMNQLRKVTHEEVRSLAKKAAARHKKASKDKRYQSAAEAAVALTGDPSIGKEVERLAEKTKLLDEFVMKLLKYMDERERVFKQAVTYGVDEIQCLREWVKNNT